MNIKFKFKSFLFIVITLFVGTACNDDDGIFRIDYSSVPELPDTTTALSKITLDNGLIYYVITEGNPESYEVTIRDDIYIYYSTRTTDDNIVQSSFANGNTAPTRVNSVGAKASLNYVGEGIIGGVLGMKEGERRVVYIPAGVNSLTSDQALIFDVELESIDY